MKNVVIYYTSTLEFELPNANIGHGKRKSVRISRKFELPGMNEWITNILSDLSISIKISAYTYFLTRKANLNFNFSENQIKNYNVVTSFRERSIVCKAPIWATEFTPLNQTTRKESPSVRIPCGFELTSFGKFKL